jgi:hypothetical protein
MSVLAQDETLDRERFVHFVGTRWKSRKHWKTKTFKFDGRDTWVCLSLHQDVPVAAQSWQTDLGWLHLVSLNKDGHNVYSDVIVKVKQTTSERKWDDAIRALLQQVKTDDIKAFFALNPSAARCH